MIKFKYNAISPKQNSPTKVFSFAAGANEILQFAAIDRLSRNDEGKLKGFQRPQVSNHIREIRDYLAKEDSILPNSIVVAFTSGVQINNSQIDGISEITINVGETPNGLIVDGQQRLTALSQINGNTFQVLVSCIVCESEEELRRQFILINNTRPLPKSLIYELLPTVNGLPPRLSSRAMAATLTERLNFDETSSIHTKIKMHTNPGGIIQDTVIQKVIMNSLENGALRELASQSDGINRSFQFLSNYYRAVAEIFPEAWDRQTPRSSRLVHGAGIIAMGYVMEYLYFSMRAHSAKEFKKGLILLEGQTSWTSGFWDFGDRQPKWNELQNLNRDWMSLSNYLLTVIKRAQRENLPVS
jgi:DGQHR domain-containing protein